MSAADRLRALGGAVQERDRQVEEPAPEPREPDVKDSVRQTVDLTGQRHLDLALWKMETAIEQRRPPKEISTQVVLAALVDVMLDDPRVGRAVRRRLEAM